MEPESDENAAEPGSPWDDHAQEWDASDSTRAYAAAAFESLLGVLDQWQRSLGGADVCDFGCGTGLLAELMAESVGSIDAVDTSRAMLDVLAAKIAAKGWTHIRVMEEVPTSAGRHDLVVCSSVLGFVDDHPATVAALAGLLRPGGLFVQWDWERDDTDVEPHGLGRDEISRAITAAGLVVGNVDVAFEIVADGEVMRPLIGVGQKPDPA